MIAGLEKTAFQQTEVGEIPINWAAIQLKDLIRLKSGFAFSSQFFSNAGPIILTPGNFNLEGGLYFEERNTKRFSGVYNKSMQFEYGDLLIVMTDLTPDCNLLGKPAFVEVREIVLHNQRIGKIELLNDDISKSYLYWIFLSRDYLNRIKETATGSTVRHTSNKSIYSTHIPLPPTLAEQTAIATALTDADALIIQLEKLIVKKKAIKQGAMQELLKPKEGWEELSFKKLVEKFIDYRGVTPKKLGMDWGRGNILALSANNVQMGYIDFAKECYLASNDLYKRWMRNGDCAKDDVLMTMEAPLGNIAFIPDNRKYILSQRTILIKAVDNVSKVFLRYLMMSERFQKLILENASGSTAQGIQRKKLEAIQVVIPEDKQEQVRIAQILSDMDAEIDKLEQRLDKQKRLKQGMMQVLLTGKIRLV